MNNLPKEKRDRLILVILLTAGILAGVYFGLIRLQLQNIAALDAKQTEVKKEIEGMDSAFKNSKEISANLITASNALWRIEADMVSGGDLIASANRVISSFSAGYKVDIPKFGEVTAPANMNLLPKFPYKQVTVTISGTAFFHDFGKFLADFENRFPCVRVQNLSLDPATSVLPGEYEKLLFKMDVVILVKPSTP